MLLAVIYLVFISLGLPDSLLGSGWPSMRAVFGVPSSYAGYVSMTISFMTILSALISPWLIRKAHTKYIVLGSVFLTVLGLLGFSISQRYEMLFVFAVPYGLGAGSVDASVNHYVAKHYPGSVMNFLHCFYGVGAVISPCIMSLALRVARWNEGYRWTAWIQLGILIVCAFSLPLWNKLSPKETQSERASSGISEAIKVPGVLSTLIAFFAYCSGEAIAFLWTPSFFAGTRPWLGRETVAAFGSLVFGGLMLGRLISGLLSDRFGDKLLIRAGVAVECIGILLVALPFKTPAVAAAGFVVTGMGMGPVYPAIQHLAPGNFGQKHSAAVIGLQMASAYLGSTFMPMAFGHAQQALGISIMPAVLLLFAVLNIGLLELSWRRLRPGS